jgi:hypothetical protein
MRRSLCISRRLALQIEKSSGWRRAVAGEEQWLEKSSGWRRAVAGEEQWLRRAMA